MFVKALLEYVAKPIFFKHLVLIYAAFLVAYTTYASFNYAYAAMGTDGLQTAAIIATIQLPITGVLGFISKLYWENK